MRRTALVAVVITALGLLPTSAYGAGRPKLRLDPSGWTSLQRDELTLHGLAPASAAVRIQKRYAATEPWEREARVTASADGSFSYFDRPTSRTKRWYRACVAGECSKPVEVTMTVYGRSRKVPLKRLRPIARHGIVWRDGIPVNPSEKVDGLLDVRGALDTSRIIYRYDGRCTELTTRLNMARTSHDRGEGELAITVGDYEHVTQLIAWSSAWTGVNGDGPWNRLRIEMRSLNAFDLDPVLHHSTLTCRPRLSGPRLDLP